MLIAILLAPAVAPADDQEGCLICHRYSMRSGSAVGGADLRVSDFRGGPHGSAYCSDCHGDARSSPHPATPGPAGCLATCHETSKTAADSHRRASYGGLTEPHRKGSAPKAPCQLCHGAGDRAGDADAVSRRCARCHAGKRESVERGVHARIFPGSWGGCAGCHRAHPAGEPGLQAAKINATCEGRECHPRVTGAMRKLGGHGDENKGSRSGGNAREAVIFLALAALGGLSARFFRGRPVEKGDGE